MVEIPWTTACWSSRRAMQVEAVGTRDGERRRGVLDAQLDHVGVCGRLVVRQVDDVVGEQVAPLAALLRPERGLRRRDGLGALVQWRLALPHEGGLPGGVGGEALGQGGLVA